MRAVLYADDMEPITVIDMEPWAYQFLREQGSVRLAVMPKLELTPYDASKEPTFFRDHIVRIRAEILIRKERETMMLFTDDEEAALLLKSELLPGQIRDAREREKGAFAQGFLYALNKLGR